MHRNKNQKGFTLIELLVVVAIIALLSSIALIAFVSARAKARNAKRLGDMTQMNYALELYQAQYKGYPADTDDDGIPDGLTQFASSIPNAPTPPDSAICEAVISGCGTADMPNCAPANNYSYVPSGNAYTINGVTVYSEYSYYFCLGDQTGNFPAGVRTLTPKGVK
jgi:prepilin-type N-terminal cleavage/methylation domain-containing protein